MANFGKDFFGKGSFGVGASGTTGVAFGRGWFGRGDFGVGALTPPSGLTTVGASLTASYSIAQRVFTTLSAQYDIASFVTPPVSIAVPTEKEVTPAYSLESFAARIYALLEPMTKDDAKLGWPLNFYIGALGHMFQEIEDYARDDVELEAPGWSILMDSNRIPTKGLDWLAQFVGITVNHDDTDDGMRQQVKGHDRWGRGTPLSITSPAQRWIPAGAQMYMSERNPGPYHVVFIFVDNAGPGQHYGDVWELFINYHKIRTTYATYQSLYNDSRGDWDKVESLLYAAIPAGIQQTTLFTTTTLYLALWILLESYQEVYDIYASYQAIYAEPFPDINLAVPTWQQLVGSRYYRNIWNQFQTYINIQESYMRY